VRCDALPAVGQLRTRACSTVSLSSRSLVLPLYVNNRLQERSPPKSPQASTTQSRRWLRKERLCLLQRIGPEVSGSLTYQQVSTYLKEEPQKPDNDAELRNRVYDFAAADVSLPCLFLTQTCRQLREEYLTVCMKAPVVIH
jgi:hypothetical protein